jgi:hypothetical protein
MIEHGMFGSTYGTAYIFLHFKVLLEGNKYG